MGSGQRVSSMLLSLPHSVAKVDQVTSVFLVGGASKSPWQSMEIQKLKNHGQTVT